MFDIVLMVFVLLALAVASYTDFERREVPDWLNFSLLLFALIVRFVQATITQDWIIALTSVVGALVGYGIGALMYYTGQWGGGDAKMLMAIGAAFATINPFPFNPELFTQFATSYNFLFFPILFFNILCIGAVYGLIWTFGLIVLHFQAFWKEFSLLWISYKYARILVSCGVLLCFIVFFFVPHAVQILLFSFCVLAVTTLVLFTVAKACEKACMIKKVSPKTITPGEWIVHDVFHQGKKICGPSKTGISPEEIELLKKYKVETITIKVGMPFIPAFFLSFLVTCIHGFAFTWVFFF